MKKATTITPKTPQTPKPRKATIKRITTETQINLTLNIDGECKYTVSTGIRFFDHMLELFTRHGGFDLTLKSTGDLDVDQHHTVEDVGIALGEAFEKALGNKKGIMRAGYFVMAMDETLAVAAVVALLPTVPGCFTAFFNKEKKTVVDMLTGTRVLLDVR